MFSWITFYLKQIQRWFCHHRVPLVKTLQKMCLLTSLGQFWNLTLFHLISRSRSSSRSRSKVTWRQEVTRMKDIPRNDEWYWNRVDMIAGSGDIGFYASVRSAILFSKSYNSKIFQPILDFLVPNDPLFNWHKCRTKTAALRAAVFSLFAKNMWGGHKSAPLQCAC